MKNYFFKATLYLLWAAMISAASGPELVLHTRARVENPKAGGKWEVVNQSVAWEPGQTALIITDMWDKHWCDSATERVAELAPAINEFASIARSKGILIIHAPSETMKFYQDHPGRKLAENAPRAANLPENVSVPCRSVDGKLLLQRGVYDLDGGCDKPCGEKSCVQRSVWSREISSIEIKAGDAISDSGEEMWNLFEQRGIKNVMLVGVHANMCIINRSFGLCNWKRQGKNAVLVRDLTDAMYNPQKPPHVDHFTGTERVVEYIEKYLAPTILSTDLTGRPAFRFKEDKR
jgi:nicotinamidase-related amidase